MTTPVPTPPPAPVPGHAELAGLAVRFLDAMLFSADIHTIGRTAWWDRARTALETGAASSTTFGETVAATARKLQITGALSVQGSAETGALAVLLADPAVFAAWRELAQADAVYITALTRNLRTSRKETAK